MEVGVGKEEREWVAGRDGWKQAKERQDKEKMKEGEGGKEGQVWRGGKEREKST